jgi:hypothetical protein
VNRVSALGAFGALGTAWNADLLLTLPNDLTPQTLVTHAVPGPNVSWHDTVPLPQTLPARPGSIPQIAKDISPSATTQLSARKNRRLSPFGDVERGGPGYSRRLPSPPRPGAAHAPSEGPSYFRWGGYEALRLWQESHVGDGWTLDVHDC